MATWIIAGLLVLLASAVTHHLTVLSYVKKTHAANLEAIKEKTVRETEDKVFSDFKPDQKCTLRRTGIINKKLWLVINERLTYKELPVSGWVEHQILVNQEMDKEALDVLAKSASIFLSKEVKLIDSAVKLIAGKK